MLVVGWDGADREIVDDLLARGLLPHLRTMQQDEISQHLPGLGYIA